MKDKLIVVVLLIILAILLIAAYLAPVVRLGELLSMIAR